MGAVPQRRVKKAERAELRLKAYDMQLSGMSLRAIGAALGYSASWVGKLIDEEIQHRTEPVAARVRLVEIDRLDAYLVRIQTALDAGGDVSKLVSAGLRVAERRAKLLGLDVPARADLTVRQFDATDVALTELINETKAKVAAEEQDLVNWQGDGSCD